MRRGLWTTLLVLLISPAWTPPAAAQAQTGWAVQLDASAGIFKSTRDIGKITTEEQAQIRTEITPAPVYSMALLLNGPSPKYSLRASVGFMNADAQGKAVGCDSGTITGPGCAAYNIPATVLTGFFDVLLHNERPDASILKYFIAGVGMRSYAFDEMGCRGIVDRVLLDVCTPMEVFLADQVDLLFRLGMGVRGSVGPLGWSLEAADLIGRFQGSGLRGEGGTQNDFVVTAGLSFPGS